MPNHSSQSFLTPNGRTTLAPWPPPSIQVLTALEMGRLQVFQLVPTYGITLKGDQIWSNMAGKSLTISANGGVYGKILTMGDFHWLPGG
jgi:hypothetical protein